MCAQKEHKTQMDALAAKHIELESAAAELGVATRMVKYNARGVAQHVVHLKNGGIMRWPVAYEHGAWHAAVAAGPEKKKEFARDNDLCVSCKLDREMRCVCCS